jgi:hypothetical protein
MLENAKDSAISSEASLDLRRTFNDYPEREYGSSEPEARRSDMKSPSERFRSKVDEISSASFWGGTRCHEWCGALLGPTKRSSGGYGYFRLDGKAAYAHRTAWEFAKGPIEKGLMVLHRCNNRKCVNVEHLYLGTHDDNMADMTNAGRQSRGTHRPNAKLTEDEILEIRASNEKQQVLADRYGIKQPNISMVKANKIWRHV